MFNSSGAIIPRVCLFPTLSPRPHNSPSSSLSGPVSSYLWQRDQREREEQYCICAPLCTRPAAKQMFRGILVAGLAPGPRLIPQWLHKHSLGWSKEQIALYRELYGNGIISTPIKVYFSLPLPSCRLFILLLQQKGKYSVAQDIAQGILGEVQALQRVEWRRHDSLVYATFSACNCHWCCGNIYRAVYMPTVLNNLFSWWLRYVILHVLFCFFY